MKEREPLSLNFEPQEIVSRAHLKMKKGKLAMSKNVAIALTMQDLGKNILPHMINAPELMPADMNRQELINGAWSWSGNLRRSNSCFGAGCG